MRLIAEMGDLDEQVVVCVDDHRPTPCVRRLRLGAVTSRLVASAVQELAESAPRSFRRCRDRRATGRPPASRRSRRHRRASRAPWRAGSARHSWSASSTQVPQAERDVVGEPGGQRGAGGRRPAESVAAVDDRPQIAAAARGPSACSDSAAVGRSSRRAAASARRSRVQRLGDTRDPGVKPSSNSVRPGCARSASAAFMSRAGARSNGRHRRQRGGDHVRGGLSHPGSSSAELRQGRRRSDWPGTRRDRAAPRRPRPWT